MNLFDTLPGSFFNCLASGSTNRVYADCLLLIYHGRLPTGSREARYGTLLPSI